MPLSPAIGQCGQPELCAVYLAFQLVASTIGLSGRQASVKWRISGYCMQFALATKQVIARMARHVLYATFGIKEKPAVKIGLPG